MICAYCSQPLEARARICRQCGMLVAVIAGGSRSSLVSSRSFPVATHKFLILSLCSLNLYQLYWFYQNWKRMRDSSGEALSPFWRAFFAVLWVIPFLRHVARNAEASGVPVRWSAFGLGAAFILFSLLWRLPDPWWLLAFGTGPVLIPVVKTCRDINQTAEHPDHPNDRYSAGNVATIVLGGLFLVLILVAAFAPVPSTEAGRQRRPPAETSILL